MEEERIIGGSGEIFITSDYPGNNPDAIILLVHGLGEHSGRYREWTGLFLRSNIGVVRFDLPGHGRSGGRRGHIDDFGKVRSVLLYLRNMIRDDYPGTPILLYGHSLGGNIVLDSLLSGIEGFSAAVVTSPWIRLAFEPGVLKLMVARVAGLIAPAMCQPTGLVAGHLSHDPSVAVEYGKDPLIHSVISVSLFSSATRAAKRILREGNRINLPLLLVHGAEDQISSPSASQELASICSAATVKIWERGYHELHNEPFKKEVFEFVYLWIKERFSGMKDHI